MNDFDAMFASAHLPTLYATFGRDATVTRGVGAPVPVRIVLNRASEALGDYGQVVARVDRVQFQASQWKPQAGDVVAWTDGFGSHSKAVEGEPQAITEGLEWEAVLHG